jgi:hypothetical protein
MFCAVTFSMMHDKDKSEYAFSIYCLYVRILSIVLYGLPLYLQNVYKVLFVVSYCKIFLWSQILRFCLNVREQ